MPSFVLTAIGVLVMSSDGERGSKGKTCDLGVSCDFVGFRTSSRCLLVKLPIVAAQSGIKEHGVYICLTLNVSKKSNIPY